MLRWHLRHVDEPEQRIGQARALLGAIAEQSGEMAPAAERALQQGDAALFHDELAEHHEAVLFTDFVAHAARHGLRFLAEADVFEMDSSPLPGAPRRDRARAPQNSTLKGRMFRNAAGH